MNFNELEKTLNDYDNNITKDVFTHAPAIVVLQMKVQDYKRARNRLDKFESPEGYKYYANLVIELNATIKYLKTI
tara:strand:+ start:1363 stop:1587 length:225 start_codon:yes stop_codon:yes gene_type:complete